MEAFNPDEISDEILEEIRSPDGAEAWTINPGGKGAPVKEFRLDETLLEIPAPDGVGAWTIGHAVEGVQIFGGIGSGKTSGSGRTLAHKFLSAGFGGLVLTAKADEKALWEEYCDQTGRRKDLVVLEPGGRHHFNFLQYEATQASGEKAITANIVQVLKTVINAGEEKKGGVSDNAFWESALDMLIVSVIDLCQLAYGTLSVRTLYDVVRTIPRSREQQAATAREDEQDTPFARAYLTAKAKVDKQVAAWRQTLKQLPLEDYELLQVDNARYQQALEDALPDAQMLKFLYEFFLETLKTLSEKTRSTIDLMFTGFLFHLLREPVYSLLCHGVSTVTPEASLRGKIILLNLPVKHYQKVGQDCQVMFKYVWQRAMEKRDVNQNSRPVFLWADEAQNFLHEHDADYQATARSSRIATVYISQNLPNYYACMGGAKADHRVKSFLGTLNTKIFHANADIETNQYASALIGDAIYVDKSQGETVGKDFSNSQNESLKLTRRVRPEEFAALKTGGTRNGGKVESYLLWQGSSLLPRQNFIKIAFRQKSSPSPS